MELPPRDQAEATLLTATRPSARRQRDFSPVSWTNYFDEAHDLIINQEQEQHQEQKHDSFRVYLKNFVPPYAPKRVFGTKLDPSKLQISNEEYSKYAETPTLVMLHGGGYSALTWAEFTRHLENRCHFRLLAIDLRLHGDTKTRDPLKMDIETLVDDVFAVTHEVHRICGFMETPKTVMIGHSMGGAIAINCAAKCLEFLPSLVGIVVIDVVEGTAKEALPLMLSVIETRPIKFASLENAIEWSFKSGMTKNCEAARVSMPGNLVNSYEDHLAVHDVPFNDAQASIVTCLIKHKSLDQEANNIQQLECGPIPSPRVSALRQGTTSMGPPRLPRLLLSDESSIINESEILDRPQTSQHQSKTCQLTSTNNKIGFRWRTNLASTQKHWNGWFDGLSNSMLDSPVQGKFLLLAGVDRLDRTLTIGHMQGKLMVQILPKCGHAVHEDLPDRVASSISYFLTRNKFTLRKSFDHHT